MSHLLIWLPKCRVFVRFGQCSPVHVTLHCAVWIEKMFNIIQMFNNLNMIAECFFKMHVSTAVFEASTDTSVDDQREGGEGVVERRCKEGDESCVAQKRVLRSRQELKHPLQSKSKQIMDNLKTEKGLLNSDPLKQSLLSGENNQGTETLKAAIEQDSGMHLRHQGQTCQQHCKQLQDPPATQHYIQQDRQTTTVDPLYQHGQRYGNGSHYQQVGQGQNLLE